MPNLYLIAVQNGAGKSTYGRILLPENAHFLPVFDGDVVYHATLKEAFARLKVSKLAQREAMEVTIEVFENQVESALAARQDFAYEGHFSGEGPWETIQRFKSEGYQTYFVFLGLRSIPLSIERVEKRVSQGGHYVSPYDIEMNYTGNLNFLNRYFQILDSLNVFDASGPEPELLISLSAGQVVYQSLQLPAWFRERLPNLARLLE